MRFSRIRLENWRNFSEVDVPLQNRVFIVGANASGKSNFLDVFRFLRDIVTPGGGFQDAVIRRGGVSHIRNLVARHPRTNIIIDVDLTEGGQIIWRYRIEFNQDNRGRPILREEKIWYEEKILVNRPDENDRDDAARLSQTYLEQTFANRQFREITDFFKSISYSHIIPQLIRERQYGIGRQGDTYGSNLIEQMAETRENVRQMRLDRIQEALKIVVPQFSDLELFRDEKGIPHLRGKYTHWRPQGAWQNETEFSDGTLRLIGLLWALQDKAGPLLLEEPELSLHSGIVRRLAQIMWRVQRRPKYIRQIFVSTHSSELLSDEGIAPDEVLLLLPFQQGTDVRVGVSYPEIRLELEAGLTIAEVVIPRTEPPEIQQLALFEE